LSLSVIDLLVTVFFSRLCKEKIMGVFALLVEKRRYLRSRFVEANNVVASPRLVLGMSRTVGRFMNLK
jgi:hypothetical protein